MPTAGRLRAQPPLPLGGAISLEGLEIAARALGCNLFLDLTWYPDDAHGNAEVRKLLDGLLTP